MNTDPVFIGSIVAVVVTVVILVFLGVKARQLIKRDAERGAGKRL